LFIASLPVDNILNGEIYLPVESGEYVLLSCPIATGWSFSKVFTIELSEVFLLIKSIIY